ncbi:MAG: nucleotidyltransferase family protein [bacterium]
MRLTRSSILEAVENHAEEIRNWGVKSLILVGSFAREEGTARSDVDFLVEFEEGRGLFTDYSGLRNFLVRLLDREIDLVKPHLIREELKPYLLEGDRYAARL